MNILKNKIFQLTLFAIWSSFIFVVGSRVQAYYDTRGFMTFFCNIMCAMEEDLDSCVGMEYNYSCDDWNKIKEGELDAKKY